jgi:hypothetical protein
MAPILVIQAASQRGGQYPQQAKLAKIALEKSEVAVRQKNKAREMRALKRDAT